MLSHDHRERAVVRGVKENLCYIAFEYDTELTSTAERSDHQIHMLSDRNIITVGAERFRCECFFSSQTSLAKEPVDPRHFFPGRHVV